MTTGYASTTNETDTFINTYSGYFNAFLIKHEILIKSAKQQANVNRNAAN